MVIHPHIPSINDILRDIYIEPSIISKKLASKYGYLPYMVERYIKILGFKDTVDLLNAFEKPLKPVVRTNTLLIDEDTLYERLEQLGFKLERIKWSRESYRVISAPKSPSIGATHEYLKGYYYVHRDSASLVPVKLLMHEFEGDVLDACAAPGGKATYIAQILNNKYEVLANDLVLYRLKSLIGHIARMRIKNIVVTWSDARKLPILIDKRYDRVLLDVPCSGEGTIMFDQGRKTRTSLKDLARIVRREIEILLSGIDMLTKNGVLAYVTCSIAPEENEYVVAKVLEMRDDIEIVKPPVKLFDWSPWLKSYLGINFPNEFKYCIRIWPHIHSMIGLTTCLLRRIK
ncbi:ribosomal RNA methyltransferase NOP2 [Staphylothermus marinus F1]|uniref:Ribosomal RNA methyltransferase NOP2 n=1 Tax=Staphylothermus marinus (strain ATCC 43588 / DSM 3639 / JCM 9404 / F1) TaxID=399550 RepID=A3DPG2_STAMF|nr:ribosomal RNA methyltransferase NOP2 [Staphylothermus marinus F1]